MRILLEINSRTVLFFSFNFQHPVCARDGSRQPDSTDSFCLIGSSFDRFHRHNVWLCLKSGHTSHPHARAYDTHRVDRFKNTADEIATGIGIWCRVIVSFDNLIKAFAKVSSIHYLNPADGRTDGHRHIFRQRNPSKLGN